jgi:hypothetical protein
MKRRMAGTLFAISAVLFVPATSAQASTCRELVLVLAEADATADLPGDRNYSSTAGKCEDSFTL